MLVGEKTNTNQISNIPNKKNLANLQEAKYFLDFNANILFLQYLLPKLVQCKQLEIPISISIFAKKERKKGFAVSDSLIGYDKDLYVIDTSQFDTTVKGKLTCNLVELSTFLHETGLDVNFAFLSDNEVRITVSKTLEKEKTLVKKVND